MTSPTDVRSRAASSDHARPDLAFRKPLEIGASWPRRRLAAALVAAVTMAAATAATPAPARPVVRFGERDMSGKPTGPDPVIAYLAAAKTPYDFKPVRFAKPEDAYEALRKGTVDFATLGPVLYAKAHHVFGAVPVVADATKASSVVFARKDSGLRTLADLRGRTLAFGYENSTMSHLVPLLLLSRAQISKDDLTDSAEQQKANPKLVRFIFAGGHENVVDAVLAGRADAGGVVDNVFLKRKDEGLRAVVVSEPFTGVPIVVRPDLDPKIVTTVRRLLLAYRPPAQDEKGALYTKGFSSVQERDFNSTRYLMKVVFGEEYR